VRYEDSVTKSSVLPEHLEPGAPPPEGFLPLCVPNLGGKEWDYVKECLDTGWVSSVGQFVSRFEREFAAAVQAEAAVATSSGTTALHVALCVSGIAPANAVRYLGAWPTFVDVEPDYWQIDVGEVERFLREDCASVGGCLRNRHTGRRVRAIMPVDILGHPADVRSVLEIAADHDLTVIEDACEALGARYRDAPVGSWSPVTCFSFNGNKVITAGGGGMIVTNDAGLAERARYLTTQAKDDSVEFIHQEVGFNYRLTNLQAALACAQLEMLDEFVRYKRRIAGSYNRELAQIPGIEVMREAPWAHSSFWMYTVRIDPDEYGLDSRALRKALADLQIQTRPLWQPLHLSPAHRGSYARPCPVAERINRDALSLPCSTSLTEREQGRVVKAVRRLA